MTTIFLEKYHKMQERYGLPKLTELKEMFKVDFENEEKGLDSIRHELSEKLFAFSERIIEPIIGCADTYSCLFEQNMISDQERYKMFELYKKIQALKWENNMLILKPDEQNTARWIAKTWQFWQNDLSAELMKTCKNISVKWDELSTESSKTNYHG